jgi:hypothetical protein
MLGFCFAAWVLSAGLLVLSVFVALTFRIEPWAVAVMGGDLTVKRSPQNSDMFAALEPLEIWWRDASLEFSRPRFKRYSADVIDIAVPLWLPFAVLTIPALMLLRSNQPLPPGACRTCGYHLPGSKAGVCSQCGAPISRSLSKG